MVQNEGSRIPLSSLRYALALLAASCLAQPVEIQNRHGGINVQVIEERMLQVWRVGTPPGSKEGISISRSPTRLLIEALPPDGDSPDIEVRIPLGVSFSVATDDGDIRLAGMLRGVKVRSLRGSLDISAPLQMTVLNIEATNRPATFSAPPNFNAPFVPFSIHPRLRVWRLTRRLRSRDLAYGNIQCQIHSPEVVVLRDWPIPRDWPLKPHTLSKAAVDRLLLDAERRRSRAGAVPERRTDDLPPRTAPDESGEAIFRSDVRMVSMSVAVSDRAGRPVSGLGRESFVVEENGERQDIRVADPEESPFNMAILLDLSGSTAVDLEHMRQAALRLIEVAGPKDRVSLYAMSGSMFYRIAALTSDREELLEQCKELPYPAGGSPLWDVIALVYDDELATRSGERNALIVISDGIDNRISGQSVPSMLSAQRLIKAAAEMDARIYPVFLLSGQRFGRNWSSKAQGRMESLAQRTGGRLFTARSVADIEPVLPELAKEMRSVYELAYYPRNQDFDGAWRSVRIKVGLPGARVRARPGYFAD